jgi:hypothetical protein
MEHTKCSSKKKKEVQTVVFIVDSKSRRGFLPAAGNSNGGDGV